MRIGSRPTDRASPVSISSAITAVMTTAVARKERTKQIRAPLERAIRLMVEEGRTLVDAAEISALQEESLRKALRKPHVAVFVSSLRREWLSGQTLQSFHKISALRDGAQSEKVQLDACKTIITAAGELAPEANRAPVTPVAIQIIVAPQHQGGLIEVDDKGVIEAPAFDPSTFSRPSPALAYVDAEG